MFKNQHSFEYNVNLIDSKYGSSDNFTVKFKTKNLMRHLELIISITDSKCECNNTFGMAIIKDVVGHLCTHTKDRWLEHIRIYVVHHLLPTST